jgi:hypothetical protein
MRSAVTGTASNALTDDAERVFAIQDRQSAAVRGVLAADAIALMHSSRRL